MKNHRDRKYDGDYQRLEGIASYCLMGIEFKFFKMRRFLEMDDGDDYIPI